MKAKLNFKGLTQNILIAACMLIISSCGQSSKEKESADFKLVIEKTNNGVKMQSIKGASWVNLSFSLNMEQTQAVDEWGMTELGKVSSDKDSNLADFLFTVKITDNRIVLKGIEGTAWSDLSFSLPENGKQAFDQFGMTELE